MNDLPPTNYERLRPWLLLAIAWVLAFDVAWLWQRANGSHANEFGANPQEATNYVTGLLMHDYFASPGTRGNWKTFAERFASHYPSVDPGAWPPAFHAIQSSWMAAFGTRRLTMLMLMAALAATAAVLVFAVSIREFGAAMAALAGITTLSLPIFRDSYSALLAEPLAAVLILAAALKWGSYLDKGQARDALTFGGLCGLGLATDLSAFALLIQAPISALYVRRLSRLWQPAFWGSLAVCALVALPLASYFSGEVLRSATSWGFTREALPFYLGKLGMGLGFVLLLFFVVGLAQKLKRNSEPSGLWISMAGTLAGALVVRAVVAESLDPRHLAPLAPMAVLFAMAGLDKLRSRFVRTDADGTPNRSLAWATLLAAALTILGLLTAQLFTPESVRQLWTGYAESANQIVADKRMGTSRILISSDPQGEGALISEIARREKRPGLVVQRSSAELQRPDRLHGGIRPRFESSEDLAAWFPRSGFGTVVVDQSIAETDRSRVHDQLVRATEDHPEVFWPMAHIPIMRSGSETQGVLTLFRVKEPAR